MTHWGEKRNFNISAQNLWEFDVEGLISTMQLYPIL